MAERPSLRSLTLRSAYATSSDSLLDDFYVPCLTNAIRYDRLAGFFSSAVLALAPLAFADFFRRGGRATTRMFATSVRNRLRSIHAQGRVD